MNVNPLKYEENYRQIFECRVVLSSTCNNATRERQSHIDKDKERERKNYRKNERERERERLNFLKKKVLVLLFNLANAFDFPKQNMIHIKLLPDENTLLAYFGNRRNMFI